MNRNDYILKLVAGPDVLDIGCSDHSLRINSPYWLHGRLRNKFPSVAGVDLNNENIKKMQELGFENLTVASAEDFNLSAKFDTIVAGELIEHLSNPGLLFARCREHIKPNGILVISTPYVFSLLNVLYAFLKYPNTCQNDEHTVWFCPKTLTELASRYDFYTEKFELIEDYEFDNNSPSYRIFARLMITIGRIVFPARLRKNNMLFVFKLNPKNSRDLKK